MDSSEERAAHSSLFQTTLLSSVHLEHVVLDSAVVLTLALAHSPPSLILILDLLSLALLSSHAHDHSALATDSAVVYNLSLGHTHSHSPHSCWPTPTFLSWSAIQSLQIQPRCPTLWGLEEDSRPCRRRWPMQIGGVGERGRRRGAAKRTWSERRETWNRRRRRGVVVL